jgi:hypothetical protein
MNKIKIFISKICQFSCAKLTTKKKKIKTVWNKKPTNVYSETTLRKERLMDLKLHKSKEGKK